MEFILEIIFVLDETKFVLSVRITDNMLRNWHVETPSSERHETQNFTIGCS